jgi:hypothetical protein
MMCNLHIVKRVRRQPFAMSVDIRMILIMLSSSMKMRVHISSLEMPLTRDVYFASNQYVHIDRHVCAST